MKTSREISNNLSSDQKKKSGTPNLNQLHLVKSANSHIGVQLKSPILGQSLSNPNNLISKFFGYYLII